MDESKFKCIEARFRSLFDSCAGRLSKESRENVQHFIEAAEVEMACESFVLSILEEQVHLSDDVKRELLYVTVALRLDKESVFRADFWQNAGPFLLSREG